MSNLTFTGKTYLVTYAISRHLMGRRDIRLSDADDWALADFLDKIEERDRDTRDRWIIITPQNLDGESGVCAVTGKESASLERVALISWEEVQS